MKHHYELHHMTYPVNVIYESMLEFHADDVSAKINLFNDHNNDFIDLINNIIKSNIFNNTERYVIHWFYEEPMYLNDTDIANLLCISQPHATRSKRKVLQKIYNNYCNQILDILEK